jgi:hypothetical protein
MSSTSTETRSTGWWARKSNSARFLIVAVVVVVVAAITFIIVHSVSSTSSASSAYISPEQYTDIADDCINTEGNWLYYVLGTSDALYMTPTVLAGAPGRQAAMTAYIQQHHYPAALVHDVNNAENIFARTYAHLAQTLPTPAPGVAGAKNAYLTKRYLQAWDPSIEAIKSSCSYSADAMKKISAVPELKGPTATGGYSLP